jgi:peroxiredoxin
MAKRNEWLAVGLVVAVIVIGVGLLVRFGPERTGVEIGQRAPDYRLLRMAQNDSVSLRSVAKDHVTLVNIWATWCGPCKEEMPAMQQAYADLANRGFKILAVSIDQGDGDEVKQFATDFGLTFDVLLDRSGNIQQVYQTSGVPESFLLDRDGTILKRVIGAHDWASPANRQLIERYLGPAQVSSAAGHFE